MNADKRKVTTDALDTLGTVITEGKRDAIHLAVEPVVAGERLYPGQDIGIVNGQAYAGAEKKLGIVDPFVRPFVPEGSMFWLVVYPRQITSLRHVWEHPDFPENALYSSSKEVADSEQWLREWCADGDGPSYETLLRSVENSEDDTYLFIFGEDAYGEIDPNIWYHLERVLGRKIENRPTYFSCSC